MTEDEMLKREIETMKDSIAWDRWELAIPHRTQAEKAAILKHIQNCKAELAALNLMLGSKEN